MSRTQYLDQNAQHAILPNVSTKTDEKDNYFLFPNLLLVNETCNKEMSQSVFDGGRVDDLALLKSEAFC